MATFKIGDKVTWSSQAAGSKTIKRGTVIEIVLQGRVPMLRRAEEARPDESYVVEVMRYSKKGEELRSIIYWPRAAALRLLTAGELLTLTEQ